MYGWMDDECIYVYMDGWVDVHVCMYLCTVLHDICVVKGMDI